MSTKMFDCILSWDTDKTLFDFLKDKEFDRDCKNILYKWLDVQGKLDAKMEGNVIKGIFGMKNSDKTVVHLSMSEIFNRTESRTEHRFDLIDYLLDIILECRNEGYTYSQIFDVVNRSARSFPSYVRENDLYDLLVEFAPEIKFFKNPVLDLNEHTDIKCEYKGQMYYIWSYTYTEFATKNLIKKLNGRRGEIPDGNHIMAPSGIIPSQNSVSKRDNINNWFLYNRTFVYNLIREIKSPLSVVNFSEIQKLNHNSFGRILTIVK